VQTMIQWWCNDDACDYVGVNDDANDEQWWCPWQEPPNEWIFLKIIFL
jgi:hypothetical protein